MLETILQTDARSCAFQHLDIILGISEGNDIRKINLIRFAVFLQRIALVIAGILEFHHRRGSPETAVAIAGDGLGELIRFRCFLHGRTAEHDLMIRNCPELTRIFHDIDRIMIPAHGIFHHLVDS